MSSRSQRSYITGLISSAKLTLATGKEQRSPETLFEEFDKSETCQHITQTVPRKERQAAKCREIPLFMTPLESPIERLSFQLDIWLTIDIGIRTYDYDKTRKLMVTKFNELHASTRRSGQKEFAMTDKCIESMLSEEALYERFILPGESHKHYANELLEIADELFLPESEAVGQFIRGVDTETRQSLIALGDSEEISTMAELLRRLMELQSNARTVKNKKTKKKRQVAVEVKKRAFWEAERRELHGELKDKLKKLRIENDIIMRAEDSLNIIIEPPPVEEADQPISHSNSFALDGPLSTDQAIRRALTDEVLGRSKRKGNQLSATEETREPDPDDDNDDSMWVDIDSDAGSSVWSLNSVLPPEGSSSSSSSSESETAEARTQMTECKESVVVTAKLPDDYPYKNEAPPSRRPRSHFVVSTSGPRRSIEPPWYNIIHAQGLYEECLKQQRTQPKKASGWPLRAPMMRPKRKDRNHRCYRLREGLHCATERVEAKKPVVEPRLSVYRPIDYSLEKAIAEEFLRGMNKLGDPRMEHTFGKREGDRLLSVLPAL